MQTELKERPQTEIKTDVKTVNKRISIKITALISVIIVLLPHCLFTYSQILQRNVDAAQLDLPKLAQDQDSVHC
jgi:hypothetical protein